MTEDETKADKILAIALDTRKFEIGLFWQRSLFFWGFIASAFVAYAEAIKDDNRNEDIAMAIAAFGLVCSVAWTLANRGSKYWQEAWEAKLETYEDTVLGVRLFGHPYEPRHQDCSWWGNSSRRWRFSVSRLAVALSDFTVGIWVVLLARLIPAPRCMPAIPPDWFWMPAVTAAYVVAMFIWSRAPIKSPNNQT